MMAVPDKDDLKDQSSQPSVSSGRRSIDLADHQIDSRDLFVGTREVTIAHAGETYRLRLTAQNKLILTK
jgi:hemin uptake protein HemP